MKINMQRKTANVIISTRINTYPEILRWRGKEGRQAIRTLSQYSPTPITLNLSTIFMHRKL